MPARVRRKEGTERDALDPAALEFLRAGIGATIAGSHGPVQATYVSRSADEGRDLWACTCAPQGRAKRCRHLALLRPHVEACHDAWGGRSWRPTFEASLWFRLAQACVSEDGRGVRSLRAAAVTAGSVTGYRIEAAESGTLLAFAPRTAAAMRLLDRLGLGPSDRGEGGRARLLERLQRLQSTEAERALNDRDVFTQRQSFERSFYGRVAYHMVREHGAFPGRCHPHVDLGTADFILRCDDDGGEEVLRLVLPRTSVEGVLSLVREAFPAQADLAIRPIPLRSLFQVTPRTELDVEVRPMVEALQAQGEARFFDFEEIERFRYGRLVYLPQMELIAELEVPGRERRFTAPTRMTLARSQVPAFVQRMEARAGVVVDAGRCELTVYREVDAIEVAAWEEEAGERWAEVRCVFGGDRLALNDLLEARDRRIPFVEVGAGWVDLGAPALGPLWSLDAAVDRSLRRDARVRLAAREVLHLSATAPSPLGVPRDAPGGAALQRLLSGTAARKLPVSAGLSARLRDYQERGVEWLLFLHENGLAGLLCDDMGLGKTHEVMAFFVSLAEHGIVAAPFLVVCPTSVMSHWRDKLHAFAPALRCTLYHGAARSLPLEPSARDVVVTSYGVLRNDLERLGALQPAVAVFDEVQHVKNPETAAYVAARGLPAGMKLGLTGTPIENHQGEIKALVHLVLPGYLGSEPEFRRRHGPEAGPAGRESLRRRIGPFVLRRLKAQVLDELPEKIEDTRTCSLSEEQRALYVDVTSGKAAALREQLLRRAEPAPYLHVFAVLNYLKRICDHPALALGCPERYLEKASGKWDTFAEILDEALGSGQKVAVFSQYLGMLDIMSRHLAAAGVGHATLTGSTVARGSVVERFNGDPECRVFLGSLRAGGVGIDLVAASVVIHYDRWWNAAREDQATDRVHRMGQRRAVQVFRLVTEGTLEERIARMIESKRALLGDVVVADDPRLAKLFTREELIELLGPA